MTIFKSLKYSCLRICNVDDVEVIDRICTCSKLIVTPYTLKAINYANNTNHSKDLDVTSSITPKHA